MKKLILTAVLAALTATTLTAMPRFGATTEVALHGDAPAVGVVLEETMFNASLLLSNESVTAFEGVDGTDSTDLTVRVAANYKYALDSKNTLLAGAAISQGKKTTDTAKTDSADAKEITEKDTTFDINAGVQRMINDRILVSVSTPVLSFTTNASDDYKEDQKQVNFLNGGVNVGVTFLFN
jgi:hypothetical protein